MDIFQHLVVDLDTEGGYRESGVVERVCVHVDAELCMARVEDERVVWVGVYMGVWVWVWLGACVCVHAPCD